MSTSRKSGTGIFLLLLLALMPLTLGDENQDTQAVKQRLISKTLIAAIENAKKQMPCGFPEVGIPPLAPLQIAHKDIRLDIFNIDTVGEINNARLDGLNDFDIVELEDSFFPKEINFKLRWNHIFLSSSYTFSIEMLDNGLEKSGSAKFSVKNFIISGKIKYSFNIFSLKVTLQELKIYVSLGEVKSEIGGLSEEPITNDKLNKIIEEWMLSNVNENSDKVAEMTNTVLLEMINEKIGDKSISDLLKLVEGINGENGACIP